MQRQITFVIHVCDVEPALSDVVAGIDEAARRLCDGHEILIVDDASLGQTQQAAHQLASTFDSVRVFSHPFNIGFSSGIKTGLAHSKCPWLMNIPTDGSFSAQDLPKFIEYMDRYDLIIGYRPLSARSLGNKVGILATRAILRVFFCVSVRETNSVKLLRKEVLKDTIIESRSFAIGSEIIIKAASRGARIRQVRLSPSVVPERKTDSRKVINGLVGGLELILFFVMKTFRLADFDPTGEDKKRVLR